MLLQEPRDDVGAEGERHAPVVLTPASDILVWVGPEQVTKQAAIRNLDQ